MDKEKQTQEVGKMIDGWLDEIDSEPDVVNWGDSRIQAIDAIIDSFVEIAIVGLDKKPDQWNDNLLQEVMFSRFMLLLEADEKNKEMYQTIPFALKKLFKYLQKQGIIKNGQHLVDWVNVNADQLQSLYNPKFDKFYRRLFDDMRRSGINTSDKEAVDKFTKNYLNVHPELGIDLYKDDSKD
ncbi:hypothetical protein BGL41_05610 [Fructilactobacillus sanfranciscensis]|uniref:hypothetical protein n=1 Tax=Fructilactobacillus sanfranciscensis TaxID=1625 RepID=UPI000CD477DA|nr:hypothetical protein [Fructilactobacillus sanfranciscensis]POH13133.1 hypothetical protein BGL41_05610 [Fructilactobacillus sanfranciscensis]